MEVAGGTGRNPVPSLGRRERGHRPLGHRDSQLRTEGAGVSQGATRFREPWGTCQPGPLLRTQEGAQQKIQKNCLEMDVGGTNLPQSPDTKSPSQLREQARHRLYRTDCTCTTTHLDPPPTVTVQPTPTCHPPPHCPPFCTVSTPALLTPPISPPHVLLSCPSRCFSSGWMGKYLVLTKQC